MPLRGHARAAHLGRRRGRPGRLPWWHGTKLRARYQRNKGRDLADLWLALGTGKPNPDRVVACVQRSVDHDDATGSRAEFEANLGAKLTSAVFLEDLR